MKEKIWNYSHSALFCQRADMLCYGCWVNPIIVVALMLSFLKDMLSLQGLSQGWEIFVSNYLFYKKTDQTTVSQDKLFPDL